MWPGKDGLMSQITFEQSYSHSVIVWGKHIKYYRRHKKELKAHNRNCILELPGYYLAK